MKLPINYPETPKGKRTIRKNVWGSVVGYVSGKRFWEFGLVGTWNEAVAANWCSGETLEEAQRGTISHERGTEPKAPSPEAASTMVHARLRVHGKRASNPVLWRTAEADRLGSFGSSKPNTPGKDKQLLEGRRHKSASRFHDLGAFGRLFHALNPRKKPLFGGFPIGSDRTCFSPRRGVLHIGPVLRHQTGIVARRLGSGFEAGISPRGRVPFEPVNPRTPVF